MTSLDDLLAATFDGRDRALYDEFAEWARDSRRFRAFALAYQSKIRAKLRNANDGGGMSDLRAELAAAARLLRDDRFTLEYEKYLAAKQRGPDLTVTFRGHTPFNVEVRRFRAVPDEDPAARQIRLSAVLCDKVGQMPPGIVNLLWLDDAAVPAIADIEKTVADLRRAAERKEEATFTRRGFESAADFLRQFARLSGVALPRPGEVDLWLNPSARHKLPPAIINAIRRLPGSNS